MLSFRMIEDAKSNKTLWAISLTCFFWSVSSCMIFSILPTFMTEELKLNTLYLGMIEGIAFSLAFVAKILSGIFSDYIKKRKPLLILGTLLSVGFKVLFALATNGWWIFFAKSFDRFSKGVRSSPADALIADISPKELQGRTYGLRQTFYTLGAVLGSFIASETLKLTNHNYRTVFWLALIPVFFALILIIFFVDDHEMKSQTKKVDWNYKDYKKLPVAFWQIIAVSFILMFARFSDSFLALKGREIGIDITILPLLMMIYDFVHSLFSYPVGYLADQFSRAKILLLGILILVVTNIVMIHAQTIEMIILGYILAGLHMGLTHSLLSTLIAEHTLPHLRGTAFSIYYLTTGIAVLLGNNLAGALSFIYKSASSPFYGGLCFSLLSSLILSCFIFRHKLATCLKKSGN